MIDRALPTRRRRIELKAPLEVFPVDALCRAVPESYRVRAILVDSEGVIDAVVHDLLGRPLPSCALRRTLGREAVRVLGMSNAISPRRRARGIRKPAHRDMIPDVWGLRLRGVSGRLVG